MLVNQQSRRENANNKCGDHANVPESEYPICDIDSHLHRDRKVKIKRADLSVIECLNQVVRFVMRMLSRLQVGTDMSEHRIVSVYTEGDSAEDDKTRHE